MSSSVLVVRLSSPKIPSLLVVKCSSHIGEMYEDKVVARVKVTRPSKPVLGEPLLSGNHRDMVGGTLVITLLLVRVHLRDFQI